VTRKTTYPKSHQQEPGILQHTADQPSWPEVSGTSFPVLTTVLAGFAVTIAVQLILHGDSPAALSPLMTVAIVILLASTLVFISSIVFAVNAQAHNYLPFLSAPASAREIFGVDDEKSWIGWLHQGWDSFHLAAVMTFYSGIALLLAGVNLLVWEFVGAGVGLAVLALILANVAMTMIVSLRIHNRRNPDMSTGSERGLDGQTTTGEDEGREHVTHPPDREQQEPAEDESSSQKLLKGY
jgi:hypothetical protein